MPGGRRLGQPGKAYPERSDLNAQPIRTAPGQPYGAAKAQADAQRAVPLPQTPPPVVSLHAPTQRPNEHVMTGVDRGPGAGPEAIVPPTIPQGGPAGNRDVLAQLKAILAVNPDNQGMRQLVDAVQSGDYTVGGPYGRSLGAV